MYCLISSNDKCRKEFHRYGAGYAPIKAGLMKSIEEKYAGLDKRNRVELKELRAQIEELRGQFIKHNHEYDRAATDDFWTSSTGGPL